MYALIRILNRERLLRLCKIISEIFMQQTTAFNATIEHLLQMVDNMNSYSLDKHIVLRMIENGKMIGNVILLTLYIYIM